MDLSVFLLILACLAVGVSGAVASTWGLRRSLYSLKLELAEVQNKLLSLVKQKAVGARWDKEKLLEEAKSLVLTPQREQRNPWDL